MKKTERSRIKLGFPSREEWLKIPAVFTKKTLFIAGHQVMQRWESNYMKMLAAIASKNGGNILEVGYGLGMSAHFIQMTTKKKNVTHHIIEAHPDVIKIAKKNLTEEIKNGRVVLYEGFWEDITKKFPDNFFNGILFDTYPLESTDIHKNHYKFFPVAYRILMPGGILTYYSDESDGFSYDHKKELNISGFKKLDYKICKVNPPKDCIYWDKKNFIAPIVVK